MTAGGLSVGVGVGLVSLALMLTQIVLTRIFSVIIWYHFAFFAISVALLGLAASALFVHLAGDRLSTARAPNHLAAGALAFSASTLGLGMFLVHVTPDWFGAGNTSGFTVVTAKLLLLFALTTLPFLLGGFVIGLALARWPEAIQRNYAWDLGGAAAACALVIPVLDWIGAPKALIVSIGFGCASALAFLVHPSRRRALVVSALVSAALLAAGVGAASSGALEVRSAKGLDLTRMVPEYSRWNSFSLINVFPSWNSHGWGLSPTYYGPIAEQKSLVIDMNALTTLTAAGPDLRNAEFVRHDLSALAFRLRPDAANTCIIGAGGGKDVLAALLSGSKHVAAVEVNPLTANDVMRNHYREFTGGLYMRDDVSVHVEDGRSYLRRTDERFDVILISMVDTSAATAAGAYALAENSLYTSSAFRDYFARLTPDGMLTVAWVGFEGLAAGARLASVAREALQRMGRDPARAVAVVETPWISVSNATMYNFVIKPAGFSDAELAQLHGVLATSGFGATYTPHGASNTATQEGRWITRILTADDDAALAKEMDGWPLDVSSVDDDRPFFFYQSRLRDAPRALFSQQEGHLYGNGLAILIKVLFASLLMTALCIGVPLAIETASGRMTRRGAAADVGYVCALGCGYMFIEIGSIQRMLPYLGQSTYALTAVLLVLLLTGALGSAFASRSDASLRTLFYALIAYFIVLFGAWGSLASATSALTLQWRALIVAVVLAPMGFAMGAPFPSVLAAVRQRNAERIPWLWGINGATSVLASVLSTVAAMHFGIRALLAAGIVAYALAAALWSRVCVR